MRISYCSVISVLALTFLQACGDPQSSNGAVARPPPVSVPNADVTERAIRRAERAVANRSYRAAHDALLHGMISAASSPALFESALKIAGELIDQGAQLRSDEALDFAEDLLGRLDQMVPHQPLEQHAALRDRLEEMWNRLPEQAVPDLFAGIDERLQLIEGAEVPLPVKETALRDATTDLDRTILAGLDTQALDARAATIAWEDYARRLQAAELIVLEGLFAERKKEFDELLNRHEGLQSELVGSMDFESISAWGKRNADVREAFRDLAQWERELLGYRESGVRDAPSEIRRVAAAQAGLAWSYTRASLDWIRSVEQMQLTDRELSWRWVLPTGRVTIVRESEFDSVLAGLQRASADDAIDYIKNSRESDSGKRAEAMVKLLLLTLLDDDMLIPYGLERYESAWGKNVEDLDDDGKLIAAKVSVLRALP